MKKCPNCGGNFKLSKSRSFIKSRHRNRNINQVPVLHCIVCSSEFLTDKGKDIVAMAELFNLRMIHTYYDLSDTRDLEVAVSSNIPFQPSTSISDFDVSSHDRKSNSRRHDSNRQPVNFDPLKRLFKNVSRTIQELERKI